MAVFLGLCVAVLAAFVEGGVFLLEQHEHTLYKNLMKNYQKWVRPVYNTSDTVEVKFGLTLRSILEVNEHAATVDFNTWWYMWEDMSLDWNKTEYFGIEHINIPMDQIWSPDLMVYNSAGNDRVYDSYGHGLAIVYYNGDVGFVPPVIINAQCKFDFTYYPYDEQQCSIKIGSWHHSGQKINLTFSGVNGRVATSNFSDANSVWELKQPKDGVFMKRNVIKYECCPDEYIDITVTFTIKRRSTYVTTVLVLPGVILAFLIPFIFMFPPDAGEKIHLGVGLILGYILLLILGDTINEGALMGSPPIIFRYYSANIVIVALSMIISMIIVQCWRDRRRASGPPALVTAIFVDLLGCLLCVNRENYVQKPTQVTVDGEDGMKDTDKFGQDGPDPNLEWKLLAMVLDRLLFIVFLVISIIVAAAML